MHCDPSWVPVASVPGSLQRIEWSECVTSALQAWDEFLYGDLTGLDLSGKKARWRRELRLRCAETRWAGKRTETPVVNSIV